MSYLIRPVFLIVFIMGQSGKIFSSEMTLDNYLHQVEEKHFGLRASDEGADSSQLKEVESDLLYSPQFFSQLQTYKETKTNPNPATGNKLTNDSLLVGISHQSFFGLQSKLSYSAANTHIYNADTTFVPIARYNDTKATLEFSLPLWRNFFGREIREQEKMIKAQNQSKNFMESFKRSQILVEAEVTYWKMALSREVVEVQRESLSRAQKIKDWAKKRVDLNLADKADYLQADAAYKVREFELQLAEQEVDTTGLNFNLNLGIDSKVVDQKISSMNKINVLSLKGPQSLKRLKDRGDVLSIKEMNKALDAGAELSRQKLNPNFEIYTSLGYGGFDSSLDKATGETLRRDYPAVAFGVKFSTPLSFFKLNDVRQGYAKDKMAIELMEKQKMVEEERDWIDLNEKFLEAKKKVSLLKNIETIQLQKLNNEKERFGRGRTTMYQVLTFEQDYANAILSRIKTEAEVLILHAQMKLFGEVL